MQRIKTIRSYTGHARFLADTEETHTYLARVQVEEIPSPYRYSSSVEILDWNGKQVVVFETRHKVYEVYQVPTELLRFISHDAATDWHIRYSRHAA